MNISIIFYVSALCCIAFQLVPKEKVYNRILEALVVFLVFTGFALDTL